MKLLDVVERTIPPVEWVEGEKIPWNDPGFSQRMLKEHLSQEHNAASRRLEIIDQHVDWIHHNILSGKPTKILDLGCGPGLYTSRLTRLGHFCRGIDFSPASIAYAREQSAGASIDYVQADIRTADYGEGYGLVMLIFGEFNVFRPEDAHLILQKSHGALIPGGSLLLEPHTYAAVRDMGQEAASWYSARAGLFSDHPHLCLTENYWNEQSHTATTRYFVVDAETTEVTRYASSMQAYTEADYQAVLKEDGYIGVEMYESLRGNSGEGEGGLIAITANKAS